MATSLKDIGYIHSALRWPGLYPHRGQWGRRKNFKSFLTARSRGSLDEEDKDMDEERALSFRPG
jgi:hypothetical protein